MSSPPTNPLLLRLLAAAGAGGLFVAGFAAGRASSSSREKSQSPQPSPSGYVRVKPGTYPPPPVHHNACYAAGAKTSPLPCLEPSAPQLPMLLGQCQHPATEISDGPSTAQYAGSPSVVCCYRATIPTCSGRPLLVGGAHRKASLARGRSAWVL